MNGNGVKIGLSMGVSTRPRGQTPCPATAGKNAP